MFIPWHIAKNNYDYDVIIGIGGPKSAPIGKKTNRKLGFYRKSYGIL
jgi:hypothetical protein